MIMNAVIVGFVAISTLQAVRGTTSPSARLAMLMLNFFVLLIIFWVPEKA